jgi:hypothetical protein
MIRNAHTPLFLGIGIALVQAMLPAAENRIDVVVGAGAPALEQLAARELAAQFQRLFAADVKIADKTQRADARLVLIGSPATNPAVKAAVGANWPKLSDQGHLLRSARVEGRDALVVGGGSPVATLWAAYELGHRFGVRYLLHGDVYPPGTVAMKLDGFDVVLEPNVRVRTWRTINDFAIGPESWGLAEHQRVLRQLAKLKFNRVMMAHYPWQPFVHYEFGGVKKQTGVLWYGWKYPIDADTAGRTAFRGAKEFTNPDFAGKETYEERTAAGVALVRGIIKTAGELGMSTGIAISPLEFPKEFAAVLPGAKTLYGLERMTVGPGPKQPPDDATIRDLAKTQLRAYVTTYPEVDVLYLSLPEFPDWVEHHEAAWRRLDERTGVGKKVTLAQLTAAARDRKLIASGERGVKALKGNLAALDFFHTVLADAELLKRPDGRRVQVTLADIDPALYPLLDQVLPPHTSSLNFIDYTARRVAAHRDLIAQVPARSAPSSLILTLADDNVGVLPQMSTGHLHTLLGQIRQHGWEGFSTRYWIIGDLDPPVYYLSRASFDAKLTPRAAYEELLAPLGSSDVVDRVIKGYDTIQRATDLIDQHDIGFTFPVPGVVMKHYQSKEPPPAWWKEAKGLYASAMDEMYRANQRAKEAGLTFTRYHAKRLEFAVHYLSSIEAVRLAGVAKSKGQLDAAGEQLEKAIESMYNALDALREVARDNCDLGVIAVLNQYGYRPLKRELEKLGSRE